MNVKLAALIFSAFRIEGGYIDKGKYQIGIEELEHANEVFMNNIDTLCVEIPKKHLPDALRRAKDLSCFSRRSLINLLKYTLDKQNREYNLTQVNDNRKRLLYYTLTISN